MNDITQRLRESAKAARALDRAALLEEAAKEIERLHSALSGYTDGIPPRTEIQFTLTDAEREAIEGMAAYFDTRGNITLQAWGSLLRVLLERMK